MLAAASFALGILLAAIVLHFTRRHKPGTGGQVLKATPLGWWTLAFGLIATTAFISTMLLTSSENNLVLGLWLGSILFAFAAVLVGIGTLRRHDRHWPTWVGLAGGLIPSIIWIGFAAGNILGFAE